MAQVTDHPPNEGFRLSQLIYDTRYRSLTIQVVAAILLAVMLAWLINNTVQNLEALGKDFDFSFLGSPAGYDINQRLIEYDSQSTHGRAALVGILNTLLVAALGCTLATILGVFVGVLRLSTNWLVSRLMAVYVEGFRNVPLLLWILLIFAVMTESTPRPSDFRGENAEASMIVGDSVAVTNRGVYIPNVLFTRSLGGNDVTQPAEEQAESAVTTGGSSGTFGSSRIATGGTGPTDDAPSGGGDAADRATTSGARDGIEGEVIASASAMDWIVILGLLAGGIAGARALTTWATKRQEATGLRPTTIWYQIALVVGPVALAMVALGAQFEYPEMSGFNFDGGIHLRNSLIALWLALSLYTSAFIAELVRASILAISKGQTEAAFALGLRPGRTMRLVILPQALRILIPPLISQYLNLTKNSSLAIAVGYMDVRSTLGGITINQTGRELEGMLLLGLFYLLLSLGISAVMNLYNSAVKLKER